MKQNYKRTIISAMISSVSVVGILAIAIPVCGAGYEVFWFIIAILFLLHATMEWAKYIKRYVDFAIEKKIKQGQIKE